MRHCLGRVPVRADEPNGGLADLVFFCVSGFPLSPGRDLKSANQDSDAAGARDPMPTSDIPREIDIAIDSAVVGEDGMPISSAVEGKPCVEASSHGRASPLSMRAAFVPIGLQHEEDDDAQQPDQK